ncbi:ABC transporter permease [Desulfosporosinus sp. PR]|uniref:ABC transporter permease n=1 Tax=Candidatus Desulfosporosinus nitrosoreducens TaxID=3401928 RepID=UPI0027E8ED51|nr:ABC transporter permease [Desulfosporosinus sp. PR]MDQ7094493.1 ABC transporter permease [Desulfosporosinus sp. PR]
MNRALFRAMFKKQGKKTFNYALGLTLYNLLLIGVFPTLSQSKGLAQLSKGLPKLARVFRVTSDSALNRFESFVASQCFGQVWILVMGIYTISTANELVAQLVSDGGMAYLLSSPAGRLDVLSTQIAVIISGLALMLLLTELGIWGERKLFAISQDEGNYFYLGVLGFALFLAVGSYSLLFSSLFSNEEQVILASACVTFGFYVLDVLASLDERFSGLKNLTIFGWFRPLEALEGKRPTAQTLLLLALSAVCLKLSAYIFAEKDLCV